MSYHVMPVNDLVEHETAADCVCVPALDAEVGNIWIHSSLDGREKQEARDEDS